MVCIACLLPLFLVPIVNLLPFVFGLIMAKIYRVFGWEYRKLERAPPACPYQPSATKSNNNSVLESDPVAPDNIHKPVPVDDSKKE